MQTFPPNCYYCLHYTGAIDGVYQRFWHWIDGGQFTYGGYQQTMNLGGEVIQLTVISRVWHFASIIFDCCAYLLVNIAYVKVIGFWRTKTSKNIATIMASKIFGSKADIILWYYYSSGSGLYQWVITQQSRWCTQWGTIKCSQGVYYYQSFWCNEISFNAFCGCGRAHCFLGERVRRILRFHHVSRLFRDGAFRNYFYFRKKTKHLDHTGILRWNFSFVVGYFHCSILSGLVLHLITKQ